MNDSTNVLSRIPGSNTQTFGGLRPSNLAIRLAEANQAIAHAWMTLDHPEIDIRDLESATAGRPAVIAMMTQAQTLVTDMVRDVRGAGDEPLLQEMADDLVRAVEAINKAMALVSALDRESSGAALRSAQVILGAVVQDVRWEVGRQQAVVEVEMDEADRITSKSMGLRPTFLAPRSDAGAVSLLGATVAGVAAALVVGLSVAVGGQAEARVLPTPPVAAKEGEVKVPSGRVRCKGTYHVTVPVRTTAVDRHGHHHAALWLQETRRGRAKLIGYAKSAKAVVKVVGCIDPSRVAGRTGPLYVIMQDVVDGNTRPVRVVFNGGKLQVRSAR